MNTFLRLSCKVIRNEFRKKKVSMCTKQEVHALSLSEATVAFLNANNIPIIDLHGLQTGSSLCLVVVITLLTRTVFAT